MSDAGLQGLCRLMAQGNQHAWRQFHELVAPALLAWLGCRHRERAEEVYQTALEEFRRFLLSKGVPDRPEAFLWNIARKRGIDSGRRAARHPTAALEGNPATDKALLRKAEEEIAAAAARAEAADKVSPAMLRLRQLRPDEFEILIQFYWERMTSDEIAGELSTETEEVTPEAVRQRLRRARDRLKGIIGAE